ncbi:MAG: hypothetical protein HOK38_06415 [Flavobacteriaceae bacterium]|nr:hypothetical protein [Flavobacteriaceae bacterium]
MLFSSLLFFLFISVLFFGQNSWKSMGVPALDYPFGDFNVVKNSYSLYSQGLNLAEVKYLKDTTIFNYPKVWIYISKYLNLYNNFNSSVFILLMILSYISVYFYIMKKTFSYMPILFFFSGSSLLLIERGNIDLLIFFMVFIISLNKKYISDIIYIAASVLKIFPAIILPFFMKEKILRGLIFLPVLVYLFLIKDQLELISSSTPMSSSTSYGVLSISIIFERYLGLEINHLFISIILVVFSLIIYIILNNKLKILEINNNIRFENMFICGGLIYVSTFLIAANWDYRLVFLTLCYPYMSIQNKISKFLFNVTLIISMHYTLLYDNFWIYGSIINQGSKIILFFIVSIYLIEIFKSKIPLIKFS